MYVSSNSTTAKLVFKSEVMTAKVILSDRLENKSFSPHFHNLLHRSLVYRNVKKQEKRILDTRRITCKTAFRKNISLYSLIILEDPTSDHWTGYGPLSFGHDCELSSGFRSSFPSII